MIDSTKVKDYVTTDATFGATGTKSTLVRSGTTITLTLGTPSGSTRTGGSKAMTWATAAGPYDRAGNALPTATAPSVGGRTTPQPFTKSVSSSSSPRR